MCDGWVGLGEEKWTHVHLWLDHARRAGERVDEDLEAGRVARQLEQPHDADDAEELEYVVVLLGWRCWWSARCEVSTGVHRHCRPSSRQERHAQNSRRENDAHNISETRTRHCSTRCRDVLRARTPARRGWSSADVGGRWSCWMYYYYYTRLTALYPGLPR